MPPHVLSLSEDAISTYVDSNGNVTTNVLDQVGQAISTSDALGVLPTVKRNANNQPITVTNARGQTLENTFDAAGNLVATRDNLSIRIGDDPETIGVMTGNFQHNNQTDQYSFFAEAGDLIWIDTMEGSVSTVVTSPSGAVADFNGRLSETGTYLVSIQGQVGTNYSVAIRSLTKAPKSI